MAQDPPLLNAARPEPAVQPAAEPARPASSPAGDAPKPLSITLPEGVAASLSYLFGWIGGLFFLLFDKRPFVRYHAAQSVVVFGTLSFVLLVLGGFFLGAFLPNASGILLMLQRTVELTWLVVAVLLILKASSGERYRVPFAAPFADRTAGTKG